MSDTSLEIAHPRGRVLLAKGSYSSRGRVLFSDNYRFSRAYAYLSEKPFPLPRTRTRLATKTPCLVPTVPTHNAEGLAVKHASSMLLEHVEAGAAAEPQAAWPDPEQDAMAAYYAAPAQPDLLPCTMKAGLLKGHRDHVGKVRHR